MKRCRTPASVGLCPSTEQDQSKNFWNSENVSGMLTNTTHKVYWCSRIKGDKDFPRYSSEAFSHE